MRRNAPKANILTFQITNQCQLRCKYCYTDAAAELPPCMPRETAYRAIDYFLRDRERFTANLVSLDFIGGEPFLYVELIEDIICYFLKRSMETGHSWYDGHMFSITTNGICYSDPKIQEFIQKYLKELHINITLDGTKKKHNTNRLYPDGRGSYENVVGNIPLWVSQFPEGASKVTLTREDLPEICDSVENLWSLGIRNINFGFVLEDSWQPEDADIISEQLKKLADLVVQNGMMDGRRLPFFNITDPGRLPDTKAAKGVCNAGNIVTVGLDGKLYPCARFAPGTQTSKPDRYIGDVVNGINDDLLRPFVTYDRRKYSSSQCEECEVDNSCNWCHAANYTLADTPTICQPSLGLCEVSKAIVRANQYFYKISKQGDELHEERPGN